MQSKEDVIIFKNMETTIKLTITAKEFWQLYGAIIDSNESQWQLTEQAGIRITDEQLKEREEKRQLLGKIYKQYKKQDHAEQLQIFQS